jgi:hypothetical protein
MKTCNIINKPTNWLLEVDGQSIPFDTGYGADYFEKHYKELGYKVIRENKYV